MGAALGMLRQLDRERARKRRRPRVGSPPTIAERALLKALSDLIREVLQDAHEN